MTTAATSNVTQSWVHAPLATCVLEQLLQWNTVDDWRFCPTSSIYIIEFSYSVSTLEPLINSSIYTFDLQGLNEHVSPYMTDIWKRSSALFRWGLKKTERSGKKKTLQLLKKQLILFFLNIFLSGCCLGSWLLYSNPVIFHFYNTWSSSGQKLLWNILPRRWLIFCQCFLMHAGIFTCIIRKQQENQCLFSLI